MLLQEQIENNNNFISYYDSSNILASKYQYVEQRLAIIFKDGRQYIFSDVIPYHYQRFKIAKSQGKSLNEFIIKNYKCEKVGQKLGVEQVSQLMENIQQLKSIYKKDE